MQKRILIVDDDLAEREIMIEALENPDYLILGASNGREALEMLRSEAVDVVITDLKMPEMDGMELLRTVTECNPSTQVILATGYATDEGFASAFDEGAFYYLSKPTNLSVLRGTVQRALKTQALHLRNLSLEEQVDEKLGFDNIIGNSRAMGQVYRLMRQVAPTRATVLITGETGTGKELIAQAIHNLSPRKDKLFKAINCASLNRELLESELFGHERGAFTGAITRKQGLFEIVDGGTLLLDEIGELTSETQAKLLRVLQEQRFSRVGGTEDIQVNVRILSATNRDLGEEVAQGRFREDLYHRLKVFPIHIPPLRERREDIPLLVQTFVKRFSEEYGRDIEGIRPHALERLTQQAWPGNVRELMNVIEKAVILCDTKLLDVEHLWFEDGPTDASETPTQAVVSQGKLADIEKQAIEATLREAKGNRTRAAKQLGIPLRTFYRKLERYGLNEVDKESQ